MEGTRYYGETHKSAQPWLKIAHIEPNPDKSAVRDAYIC
jgi:hypothetical protein